MALTFTSVADVRSRWIGVDPLTATDEQIETILEDAEDTVLREFPDLPKRIEDQIVPERRVRKVIARVVIRHLRNPEGVRSRMDVSGPFTKNVTLGGDEPGALYLTDEDRAELGGHKSGGAFTIDTMPVYAPPAPVRWSSASSVYPLDEP